MDFLIIEDEEPAARRLVKFLKEIAPDARHLGTIVSVQSAIAWFQQEQMPDLILMDVNLADGLSFEIFSQVDITCPIIFTTAFDQYAMDAFKVNSIDYLLKPVKKEEVENALRKLDRLRNAGSTSIDYKTILSNLNIVPKDYRKRFVIRFGEHIKTVNSNEVAYFYTENKVNFLCTHEARRYPIEFHLDELEGMLDPEVFFRINRQFIISIHAIDEMKAYSKSRVNVKMKPPTQHDTIVSVERSAAFKHWLGGEVPED